jgi:hypothetical protein
MYHMCLFYITQARPQSAFDGAEDMSRSYVKGAGVISV